MTEPAQDAKPLQGERVAFTGRLASMTRARAVELVQACGGELAPRVTKDTSLLVVGQDGCPLAADGQLTRRLQKARRLQATCPLRIVPESEWLASLGPQTASPDIRRLSSLQLATMLGVSGRTIRSWVQQGLVQPAETLWGVHYFDFGQVAWAKSLRDLMQRRIPLTRIRRSLEKLRTWLPGVAMPLTQVPVLECDGRLLVRLEPDRLAEATGQLTFDFEGAGEPETLSVGRECQGTENWLEQGVAQEQACCLAEAEKIYRTALRVGGPDAQVCFNLANVLFALGHPERAIERYRQVVEIDSGFAQAWNNLGTALAETGQTSDALDSYRDALQIDPLYADAHYNLADLCDEMGDLSQARVHWQAYLRLESSGPWAEYARRRLSERAG